MFAMRTPLAFGLALFAVNQVLVSAGENKITINDTQAWHVYIPQFDEAKHGAIVFQMNDRYNTSMTVSRATSDGYLESKVKYVGEPLQEPDRHYESFRPGLLHFVVRMNRSSATASELARLDEIWATAYNKLHKYVVDLTPESELAYIVAFGEAVTFEQGLGVTKMDVWLAGHGKGMSSTMDVGVRGRQLTILPKLMSDMLVYFRKYTDAVKEVISALQTQRTLPAPDYSALEMLWAIANDMAESGEEKRLVRWLAVAIASLPRAADNSGPSLVTDLDEYLSGSIDAVRVAAKQQDTAMKKFMFNRAQTTIAELNEKLNATLHSLNLDVLPAIRRELETLIAKENEVRNKIATISKDVTAYLELLKQLEARRRCARFFDILGQVLESVGKVISTGFESHGAGVEFAGGSFSLAGGEWGNDLDSKIAELKEEIARQMKLGEDYGIIQELLVSTESLLESMVEAGAKGSLGLRTWLASPAVLNFRSKLVLMTPENFEAAQSGNYIASILADVCQNIIGTMDKAEYYIGQKNIINQLTPPLPSTGDSDEFGPMVTLARTMVYENMVLANHRTVRQGMQLFAFPFCSVVRESLAENCESGRTLEELVRCSTDDLTRLRGAIRQDSSASSRGDDGLSCSTFDVAHGRDSSYTTWTNAEYGAQIRDLLAGKRVLFNADVATSLEDTFAVKFNALSIKFWNGSYTKHQGLHTALEQGFRLQLTHMGNSYFKCGSDVVTFPHRLVTLLASFSVHANGEPEFASEDYLKFLRGDAFLSPYATWAVQLIPVSTRGVAPTNFSSLQAFANDDVNMSLVGYGTFVETARHCQECEGTDFKTLKSGTVTSKVKPRPRPNRPNKLTKLKPQQGLQASSRNCPWRPLS